METILNNLQIIAFLMMFLLTAITGPIVIPYLRKLKFGQTVRDDGPQSHLKKTGTPTMGGVIFMIPLILVTVIISFQYPEIIPVLLVTVAFGIIGFIDDFIKVKKKRKDGLYANQKSLLQLITASAFAIYTYYFTSAGSEIFIPYINFIVPGWLFILFTTIFMYGMSNAVNITDGLDGLAGGVTFVVALFFSIMAIGMDGVIHVKIFSTLIAGGCLGFLIYNIHPAKVFMGDTGSLALGGAVGAISILMKMPFVLLLVGGIYVIEALSVILQVGSFKLRGGKRIFKMAPIHHHFELTGWSETRIVKVFIGATIFLSICGLFYNIT
jgi:phospho-N-acetylmuramoyl-pentapeptide-transferase